MKLIQPSYQILEQKFGNTKEEILGNLYKHIELCGRTCYKSEDKITEDSAIRFVNGLIKSKHYSVLEHGAVYLKIEKSFLNNGYDIHSVNTELLKKYQENPYSKTCVDFKVIDEETAITYYNISTNYRVIVENGWEEDLQYICAPTEFHEKRYTVKLTTSLHVYKDLTRHRKMSFSIESTRYCNYSKGKFGSELTFIEPCWKIDDPAFIATLETIEEGYLQLIEHGWFPQQASEILPQCIAADVVISGFKTDLDYLFRLRTSIIAETGQPHPEVSRIIDPLYKEFNDR